MAKDDLSVKINVGFDVNKNELDQAKAAIAAIKAEIESANNLRLKVSPSGGAAGNPVALQPLQAMLSKAISGGQKPDFKKVTIGLINHDGLNLLPPQLPSTVTNILSLVFNAMRIAATKPVKKITVLIILLLFYCF